MTSLKFLWFLKNKLETPYVVSYFFNRRWERRSFVTRNRFAGRAIQRDNTSRVRDLYCRDQSRWGGDGFVFPPADSSLLSRVSDKECLLIANSSGVGLNHVGIVFC